MTLAKKAETWSLEKTNKIGFQQNHLTKRRKRDDNDTNKKGNRAIDTENITTIQGNYERLLPIKLNAYNIAFSGNMISNVD